MDPMDREDRLSPERLRAQIRMSRVLVRLGLLGFLLAAGIAWVRSRWFTPRASALPLEAAA